MNRNDIRPAAIGVAAALAAFGGIYVWLEYEPWERLGGALARRQLTPEERAELDQLAAEQRVQYQRSRDYIEQEDKKRTERNTEIAAGFNPDLLNGETVTSARELDLAGLVAEIEHAEQAYRSADRRLLYPHREALFLEFQRRNDWTTRATASRADRLRLDIADKRVKAARSRPLDYCPPPPMVCDYPEFAGPDLADYDLDFGE